MKEIDFLDAVGRVDKLYIEECITYKPPKKMNVWIKRMSATAACFVLVIAVVLVVSHMNQPVIIDENGFYIEDGVLLRYTGSETDITIPEEVETIADYTFLENANANKIEVVRLGTNVQKVEVNAFAGLETLVDLIIAENNLSFVYEDGLIMTSDGSILLHYEREGEISFTIPDSVRFVAAHAVQMTELEEIDFGEKLEYIGYNAFASNTKLKAIYLPDSLKYISEGAFSDCRSAVDGYIPDGVEFGGEAFSGVPFYLSMLAGQMSPLEERIRGLITRPEEIVRSDLDALEVQIFYTLAALRGEEVTPTDEAVRHAYAVGTNAPEIPDGMVLPGEFSMSDITYTEGTYVYDVSIHIPAGDYTIVLQATPDNMSTALYWEDVVYRVLNLFYLQNPEIAEPEDAVSAFGWTAVFERDALYYGDVTFTHEDGRVVRNDLGYLSAVRPVITFSPDGTRAAVEYQHQNGQYSFYIVTLNGDVLMSPNYPYAEYLNRYYGTYVKDSLYWVDEDNIEGRNEYGWFKYNIYEFEVTQLRDVPIIETNSPDIPPCLGEEAEALPDAAEEARIKYSIIGGSPVVYVFDDDLQFYLAYLNASDMSIASLSACTLSLPDGYTDGRIVTAEGAGGSDEFRLIVAAKVRGIDVMLDYLFCCENFPQPASVSLYNPSDSMLYLSVQELEQKYGRLTPEYSEHGPGQPVYSMEYMDGVYLVFHNWNMDTPLEDDMVPDEIIITDEVEYSIYELTVGRDISEFTHILYGNPPEVSYSVMNGTAQVKFDMYGIFSAECVVNGQKLDIPDEVTAQTSDWEEWAENYLKNPTGEIMQIRVGLIP